MSSYENARFTFEGRKVLIERIAFIGLILAAQASDGAWQWEDRLSSCATAFVNLSACRTAS
jgi:hypothetical protein